MGNRQPGQSQSFTEILSVLLAPWHDMASARVQSARNVAFPPAQTRAEADYIFGEKDMLMPMREGANGFAFTGRVAARR